MVNQLWCGLVAKSCPTLATPWTISCQAPLSMGFSRQEYWNGLRFPSPEDLLDPVIEPGLLHCRQILYRLSYEGSPWSTKKYEVKVAQLCLTLRPHGLCSPWNSPDQNTGVDSLSLLQGDLPNPGTEPRIPALQADSLPAEPSGKPKNTGVGSLSLLQWIFLTQELNQGLLHCRRILYHLSYQGSPEISGKHTNICVKKWSPVPTMKWV